MVDRILKQKAFSYQLTTTGGKHFSKDLQPLDADGNPEGMWGVSHLPPPTHSPISHHKTPH